MGRGGGGRGGIGGDIRARTRTLLVGADDWRRTTAKREGGTDEPSTVDDASARERNSVDVGTSMVEEGLSG